MQYEILSLNNHGKDKKMGTCAKFHVMISTIVFALSFGNLAGCTKSVLSKNEQFLSEFAASNNFVVFSLPMPSDESVGLAIIDRSTQAARIINLPAEALLSPSFSPDGQRLLFVRTTLDGARHELVSCTIHDWDCRILLQTSHSISSPVECPNGSVIYSSGTLTTSEATGRVWANKDLWIVNQNGPKQITHSGFFDLGHISCLPNGVLLSALGENPSSSRIIAEHSFDPSAAESEIYRFDIDFDHDTFIPPKQPIRSMYAIGPLSVQPRASLDGRRVAFLNTPPGVQPYRYDLVTADGQGNVIRRIKADMQSFSWPAITGNQVLANQFYGTRYETLVTDFAQAGHDSKIVFPYDKDSIAKLEHISLHWQQPK